MVADDWVVQALDPGVVEADAMSRPFGAEGLVLGRGLSDEVGEAAVVRLAPGFRSQDRDDFVGHVVPVGARVCGAARGGEGSEKDKPGFVRRLPWGVRLRTNAGAPVIASRVRCTPGRIPYFPADGGESPGVVVGDGAVGELF